MNLPGDKIHCIDWGYGILLFPWFTGWIARRFENQQSGQHYPELRIARRGRFHNCRVTGVH